MFQSRRFNVAIINLTMMNVAPSKMLSIQQSIQEGSQAGYAHRLINIYTRNSFSTFHHVDQETPYHQVILIKAWIWKGCWLIDALAKAFKIIHLLCDLTNSGGWEDLDRDLSLTRFMGVSFEACVPIGPMDYREEQKMYCYLLLCNTLYSKI